MDAFSGFEPQLGEIRALRSFRIGRDGRLYPLFSDTPWADGTNTAICRVPAASHGVKERHQIVDPDCTCGFYAYADERAAAQYPNARHVLAVVACWGRVIAGTCGLRCEHARVEAIWMSPSVPCDLGAQVGERYPTAAIHVDRATMLDEYPPTQLDCYEQPTPDAARRTRIGMRAAVSAALVLGLLPWKWLSADQDALLLWIAALIGFFFAAITYGRRTDVEARKRSVVCSATLLWLMAPLAGPAGFVLLRLPVLQMVVLTRVQRASAIRAASRFPAEVG
ncbi:MAG: hypothetical protein DLM58_22875 [Pseudonocardiales bacterium]|nr:MAG: hypothetical protein DLM58_22875 [Pseudonocardiales bacterium]